MITSLKNLDFCLYIFMLFDRSVIHFYRNFLIELDLRWGLILGWIESWWLWFLQNFEIALVYGSIRSFANTIKHLIVINRSCCENLSFFKLFLTNFRLQNRLEFSVAFNKCFSMLHSSWLQVSSYFWLIRITFKCLILNDFIQIYFNLRFRWL